MNDNLIIGSHVMINVGISYGYLICKYCGFELMGYYKEYNEQIIKLIKCLSDDEKIIKDLLE